MELLIIFLLILLNGVFAMAELALVSSRNFKLENAKKKGSKGAETALELSDKPTKFLSTIQIGITLIGILLGVYSGENLTDDVAGFLDGFAVIQPYSSKISTAIIVVFITYFTIVFGELLPKRLGMTFPEPIITRLARPMKALSVITSPFVWLLSATNNLFLRVLGIKERSDNSVSEEEIKSMIRGSSDVQEIEHIIVERVFELGDRKVNTLLTHRNDIVFFTINDTWEIIKQKINQEKHSAYPVSRSNDIDDMIGLVLLKDLFAPNIETEFKLEDYIVEPPYINENTFAYNTLEVFKKERLHYGMVIDEYGTIQGIVTMDDVMDALIGDSSDRYQEEYKITKRNENSWFVDGQFSLIEFAKHFEINLDRDIYNKYTTVAGLIIYKVTKIPEVGNKIQVGNYELEIMDKDGQRIDKILVTQINSHQHQ